MKHLNEKRNKSILDLHYKWKGRQDILEIMKLTTDYKVTQAIVDNVIRERNAEVNQWNFDAKKFRSLERSKQRLQEENTFLRRQVREVNREDWKREEYEEVLKEIVSSKIKSIKIPTCKPKNNTWRYFSSTDWHLGKQNTWDILKRIWEMKEHILSCPEQNITLAMLWDLWENLSQNPMHSWQHLHMEYLTLKDNIDLATWIFYDLIESITKKKSLELVMIWGNHDRLTEKNDHDLVRSWMFMLVQILEARYKDNKNLTIVYNTENRVVLDKKDLVLDLGHWDFNFNKDKLETIRQKGNLHTSKHIVRNSGHRHSAFLENALNITRVITPAFAWKWDYDWRLDLYSNCWYTTISTIWKRLSIETIFFN